MSTFVFGPFQLDASRLLLTFEGNPLPLGPKVVETLLALVERPGAVCSKNELLDRIWPEGYVEEANLAQNIYVIRKALRQFWNVDAIATVPRRGYRFSPPVHRYDGQLPAASHAVAESTSAGADAPARRWHTPFVSAAALLALAIGGGAFAVAHRQQPARVAIAAPLSPDGARLYAMGEYYWNTRTAAGLQKSLRYFGDVVRTDPRDARGYAALAEANSMLAEYRVSALPRKTYEARAQAYAVRALAIDGGSGEAHAAMGLVYSNEGRYRQAHLEFRRAIALDPAYAPAHEWYGVDLLIRGRSEEAYRELQTAARLAPLAVATTAWLSEAAYFSRHYERAVSYAQQALDLSPQRSDAYEALGLAYEARGQFGRAIATYDRFSRSCDCAAEAAALRAHAFARMHRYHDADRELLKARLSPGSSKAGTAAFEDVAMAFIAMGRRGDALHFMRGVKHVGYVARTFLAIDPRMDPVRADARFRAWTQQPA